MRTWGWVKQVNDPNFDLAKGSLKYGKESMTYLVVVFILVWMKKMYNILSHSKKLQIEIRKVKRVYLKD